MIFGFKTKKDRRIEELETELKEVLEQNRMLTNGNNFPYSRNVKIVPCCITRTVSASYGSQYVGEKFFVGMGEKAQEAYRKKTLRHEIMHAFLNESGLSDDSNRFDGAWAKNEEMVDWFAIQSPKIFKVFVELGILENNENSRNNGYIGIA